MKTIKQVAAMGGTLALLVSASACDPDKLTEINRNPNAPEEVGPELLFPTGTSVAVDLVRTSLELVPQGIGSTWPQYLAEYQYPEISYYLFRPTTADGLWSSFYSGPLQDFEQALRQAKEAERPNQIGPILVMRAWTYSYLTGMWGDIPFTEANKGDPDAGGVITPAYDKQQVIYDSLLANLASVSQMLPGAGLGLGTADPVYGTSGARQLERWEKFANSLRARLGLNLSKVDPARAQSEVAAAINAGGFESNDDQAKIIWPANTTANSNPWWANQLEGGGTRDDARFAATFIDTLKALNDPRLPIYARPTQASVTAGSPDYAGMPVGLEAGAAGAWGTRSSRLGAKVFGRNQPSYLMTYAEFSFIKAEAAERGWIPGGSVAAAQYYQDGIRASMQDWGVADAAIATYLAQPSVQYVPGTEGIHRIIVQKWIAGFTAGYEAWSEWRRTGYPNFAPAQNARTPDGSIPRRVLYPQNEQSFNDDNLQAAISAQGGAELTNRIWIDKP